MPAEFDLHKAVDEDRRLLEKTASSKSITIVNEVKEPFRVYADQQMINTILRNLLSNSIKFTNNGGSIIVSAFWGEDEWYLQVKDNGIGMKNEIVQKLFRLDEKVSTRGTEGEEGTGLGLILCHDFAQQHGGTINVESEVGSGSTFTLSIPFVSKETGIELSKIHAPFNH